MRSSRIAPPNRSAQISTLRATDLVMSILHADADALAASMLKTVGDMLPVSQCTVFAYEFDARPRTVSAADHRGGHFLRDVAERYATHFFALDGNRAIIGRSSGAQSRDTLVLHRQQSAEIENEAYRAACYAQPNVSDRLSTLVQIDTQGQTRLDFYVASSETTREATLKPHRDSIETASRPCWPKPAFKDLSCSTTFPPTQATRF